MVNPSCCNQPETLARSAALMPNCCSKLRRREPLVIARRSRILLRLEQGLQARFLRLSAFEVDGHALQDLGIVGQSLVEFCLRQGMHTSRHGDILALSMGCVILSSRTTWAWDTCGRALTPSINRKGTERMLQNFRKGTFS